MLQAEELWLKDIQFQLIAKAKTRKWEREFGLYRDERGILRCEGRLKNAELTTTQKHPAILDTEHYVTSLIVRDSHERVKHNGVKETLTEIRSKFWIVRGRQYVRKLIHECAVCRRHRGGLRWTTVCETSERSGHGEGLHGYIHLCCVASSTFGCCE